MFDLKTRVQLQEVVLIVWRVQVLDSAGSNVTDFLTNKNIAICEHPSPNARHKIVHYILYKGSGKRAATANQDNA